MNIKCACEPTEDVPRFESILQELRVLVDNANNTALKSSRIQTALIGDYSAKCVAADDPATAYVTDCFTGDCSSLISSIRRAVETIDDANSTLLRQIPEAKE